MDVTSLSLEQQVGQLFFIGIPGPGLDNATRELLDEISPGGVCLFARNIKSRAQTRKLLDDIRGALPMTPLLSVDQEGGLVDRLRRIMTPLPAAASIGTTADAAELGDIVGATLSLLGFNMDFAPVVDVVDHARAAYSNGLFTRPFGTDREAVAELAGAFLDALQAAGILGCLKHFPGLGAAAVDSHEELPLVDVDPQTFEEMDLYPYRELLKRTKSVMVAHAAYPSLSLQERDQNGKLLPSSLSQSFVGELLRGELEYNGLVVTDDLEMGAIVKNYGIGDACKLALNAGADMLAICADPARIREGYFAALDAARSGGISEDRLRASVQRIFAAKASSSPPAAFDEGKLDSLSARTAELNGRLN